MLTSLEQQRTLKAEIALPAYAAMTDTQIAAALNAANVTAWVDIEPIEIYATLLNSGEWGRIEMTSRFAATGTFSTPTPQDNNVARLITFVRMVQFPRTLPTSRSAVRTTIGGMLDALVTGGFISSATRTAIAGLAQRTISRATELGLPVISADDVVSCRAVN